MLMMFYCSIVLCVVSFESIGFIIVQSTHVVAKFIRSVSHSIYIYNVGLFLTVNDYIITKQKIFSAKIFFKPF